MADPSRWLNWQRAGQSTDGDGPPATKPAKPTKPPSEPHPENALLTTKLPRPDGNDSDVASRAAQPVEGERRVSIEHQSLRALKTVDSWFDGRNVPMTVARHNLAGENRFGQDSGQFPYCFVNMAEWRDCPFDLRLARWFRSQDEAVAHPQGCIVSEPREDPNDPLVVKSWRARFAGDIEIELRQEQKNRWAMDVIKNGRCEQRKAFASPFLEHSKRTAAYWYGTPLTPWSPAGSSESEAAE
jgi:hypothetical protein